MSKLSDGRVIKVGDTAALDALERLKPMILRAFVVQIMLQIIVDGFAVGLRQPALVRIVAVAEIVTVAAGQEVEAGRLVRRIGTAVRSPDQVRGRVGRARCFKSCDRCVEEQVVGFGFAGLGAGPSEEVGDGDGEGQSPGKEADNEEEDRGGKHLDCLC